MAKGIINLQKESGGVTKITSTDGVSNTEVVLPESGELVTREYTDTKIPKVTSTDNAIVRFDGTSGEVQNSGVIIDDNNRIIVKNNRVKPWFTGHKVLSTGDYSSFFESSAGEQNITNNSYRYAEIIDKYVISGLGASKYVNNFGISAWYNAPAGTEDSIITWIKLMELGASGNLLLTSGTGALGYGAGAGGTVTQLTSKSTAVTLNKPCGRIIMNNSSLAAGAVVGFAFNNNLISANDKVEVEAAFSGVTYNAYVYYSTTGTAYIAVENKSGTDRTDVIYIKFAILKGATS